MSQTASPNDAGGALSAEELGGIFDRERLPASRDSLTEPLEADSQRERLLCAMARSCGARGYEETTVAEVAGRAGVSVEEFHRLFRDKEDCFNAAMELAMAEAMGRLVELHSLDKPWATIVREGVAALLGFLADRPDFARVALVEAPATGDRAFELYSGSKRVLQMLLDRGRQDPMEERGIPASAGRAAIAAAEALAVGRILDGRAESLRDLLPEIVYVATVPYVGLEGALRQSREAALSLGKR